MVWLVSGNPGSGKSTLTAELRQRGLRVMDADVVPGLAAWLDEHGLVIGDGSLTPTRELLDTCFWGWSGPRLQKVIEDLGEDGVLLGIAVNQWQFTHLFDRLVLLELDLPTQRRRVASRDPLFQEQIEQGLPVFQAQMIERGAARLDAGLPTPVLADALIELMVSHRPYGT